LSPRIGTPVTEPFKLDLGEYLPYLVNRVGTIIADQFGEDALAPYRLSIAMWRVMAVLASNGGQRQTDLADLTSIDVSTLSRLVTRLVRAGLVTRTRSASSNREVVVKLTAKGRTVVGRLIPIAREYEKVATAGLTSSELAVLKRCLRRVYGNMRSRPAPISGLRSSARRDGPDRHPEAAANGSGLRPAR
jgi:MarR family transcriptional regulator, organic hydroperoxide resistance regulator